MKSLTILLLTFIFVLTSCERIETGNSLDKKDVIVIKNLGLLDPGEKIIQYYSNYQKDKAGNFFTNKRIAHYWLDRHNNVRTEISSAYYPDIVSIDTIFDPKGDFVIPYMNIKRKDSSTFKVYIDGTHQQEKIFFEEAIKYWRTYKK